MTNRVHLARREKGTPLKELMWNCGDDPKSKGGRE